MKTGYYKSTITILLFLFSTLNFWGQSRNLQDHIAVKKNQLQAIQGNIIIDIDILLNGVEVSSDRQLVLTPTFKGEKNILELQPVVVNGKKRANLYKRSLVLRGVEADTGIYSMLNASKKAVSETIPYKATVAYQQWMKQAPLYLVAHLCGCGGHEEETCWIPINDIDFPGAVGGFKNNYVPSPSAVFFIAPPREEIKKRDESGEAYLIFKVDKWDILPELFNNKEELAKIERSLQFVKEEPTAKILSVSIKAYASPEDTYEHNLFLSKNRAEALNNYVKTIYNVPASIITSEGMGEAWDDLIKLVEADTKIESKAEVLRIMRKVGIFEGREKQLMELAGGRPYKYMLETYFPRLRRSDYKIEYTVPAFTIEKGKDMLDSKPVMLSLAEMYEIANTYPKGSADFNEVFEKALTAFPEDKIANLNAASAYLLNGNFDSAKKILLNFKNEPEAWNNLGIVFLHENNFQEAEFYLKKAEAQGFANAKENLAALAKVKKEYEEYLRMKAEYELY